MWNVIMLFQWVEEISEHVQKLPWPLLVFAYAVHFPRASLWHSPSLGTFSLHPFQLLSSLTVFYSICTVVAPNYVLPASLKKRILFNWHFCKALFSILPTVWSQWGWKTVLSATLMWSSTESQVRVINKNHLRSLVWKVFVSQQIAFD